MRRLYKTVLSLLLLCWGVSSQAVHLSTDGTGQVLLFPYYTVNEGFQSLLLIRNDTDQVKALKVRFLEGSNSRVVIDFNLYLGAFDTWTASIFALDENGAANLITTDISCTVPDIIGQTTLAPTLPVLFNDRRYAPFRDFAYTGLADDAGPDGLFRTRQGTIEVFEMGELTNETMGSAAAATISSNAPGDCERLNRAWQTLDDGITPAEGAYWLIESNVDLSPATGGLSGFVGLVDVIDGVQVMTEPEAIKNFTTSVLNFAPGNQLPNLEQADYDDDGDFLVNSYIVDSETGKTIETEWARGVDAVSAVLMADEIQNEYVLDDALDAVTEWVVSFPTKRRYTDPAIVGNIAAIAPFTELYDSVEGACEVYWGALYDRNSLTPTFCPPDIFCGPGVPSPKMCSVSNVITFDLDGNDTIFGRDAQTSGFIKQYDNGWAEINVDAPFGLVDEAGVILHGLPMTGFSIQRIKNGNLGGVLANYAGMNKHRRIPRIEIPAATK